MTNPAATVGQRLVSFLPNLRRFAISLCRSRELADDLVQATCERALAAAASFDPDTRFDAWVFRILRNLWIDQVRRGKTSGTAVEIDDALHLPSAFGEASAEASIALKQVWAAVQTLPEEQREVLILVCVEEFSYRDVADVLAIPIGTVMSRLARARKTLAELTGITAGAKRSSPEKDG
jgi:RNA polymerase sigma-70 factor (ECF subfamily)